MEEEQKHQLKPCRCAAPLAAAARRCLSCLLPRLPALLTSTPCFPLPQDAAQKINEVAEALERRQQLREANLNPARPGAHVG